jgi:integrase
VSGNTGRGHWFIVLHLTLIPRLYLHQMISVMTFAARIGAVVAMRVEDYYPKGKRWWVRLNEKGGKRHEMPAHHNLEAYLDSYIEAAGIRDGSKAPLFRSAAGGTGTLTEKPMNRVDAWRMIQRRAAELSMRLRIGCHTFRATGITAYLEAGGTLENAKCPRGGFGGAHHCLAQPQSPPRLAKDVEATIESSVTWLYIASVKLMSRRLAAV